MITIVAMFNLVCCGVIALTGIWLVTDCSYPRRERACYGIICCGALVSVIATGEALAGSGYLNHTIVWPSEALVNFGAALLMIRRAYRSFDSLTQERVG